MKNNLQGILQGLTNLMDKLGELAEKGSELKRNSTVDFGKDAKGAYGFSIKVGKGERPTANHKPPETTDRPLQETRELLVDIFDEDDHVLVVAEIPGVTLEDVQLEMQGDVLIINVQQKKYYKEFLLPATCVQEKMQTRYYNNILEIKCPKSM